MTGSRSGKGTMKKSVFALFALPLGLAAACSSSAPADPPPAGVDASADVTAPLPDAGKGGDAAPAADGGPGDAAVDASVGECGSHPGRAACSECCVTKYTDGAGAYLFFVNECMCVKERCADACATNFCSPDLKDPDVACNNCLSTKNSECAPLVGSQCTADADCAAFDKCMGESGCLKKL